MPSERAPKIFIKAFDDRAKETAKETLSKKEIFKNALRKLFEAGKTPETIIDKDFGKLLGIKPAKQGESVSEFHREIQRNLRPLFGSDMNRETVVRYQYQRYLEDKESQK